MSNNKYDLVVGIDVSKSDLDVAEYNGKQFKTLKIKNTKSGIRAYLSKKDLLTKRRIIYSLWKQREFTAYL